MTCSKNTRNGSTTSAMRGNDVRGQFAACKNCMSSLAVLRMTHIAYTLDTFGIMRHDTIRIHFSPPNQFVGENSALVSSDEQTNILQPAKNFIQQAQERYFILCEVESVVYAHLAIKATQQISHHTLKILGRIEYSLWNTSRGKQPSGVTMVKTSFASGAKGICQYPWSKSSFPKHFAPNNSGMSSWFDITPGDCSTCEFTAW